MNRMTEDLLNDTVLFSPKPKASSTVQKKPGVYKIDRKYAPIPINYSAVSEGISCDLTSENLNVEQLEEQLQRHKCLSETDVLARLRNERLLAQNVINKANKITGLPSKYVGPSDLTKSAVDVRFRNQSTVNESDLLRHSKTESDIGFYPTNKSTPRESQVTESELSFLAPNKCGNNSMSLHQSITQMSEKIRNSDISLKDLCSEFNRTSLNVPFQGMSEEIDSRMFLPAELLTEKLEQDEMSWRREKGPLTENKDANFSNVNTGTYMDSLGDFFQGRSEDIADNFFRPSPEKKCPVALIDVTNISDSSIDAPLIDDSIMSVSQIAKLVGNFDSESPSKVVNMLLKKGGVSNPNLESDNRNKKKLFDKSLSDSIMVPERDGSNTQAMKRRYETDVTTKLALNPPKDQIVENKENHDKSITSTRSVSSLDELPDGKLPIKSTRTELVWGCLRLGRNNIQQFYIRNKLNQKIRFQASVTGPSFRILRDHVDSDMLMSIKFSLHPLETKTVTVLFCPTMIGACSEKLYFSPIINGEVLKLRSQIILLTGYGGHSSVDIGNISKDTSGKFWLSMGNLLHQSVVTQTFSVKNNGTLSAFVCMDIGSRGLYSTSNLLLEPKVIVLKPKERGTITITYCPSKQDFRNRTGMNVLEIAYIKVISGAEPIRGRMKRLYLKLKQGVDPIDPLIDKLSQTFPGENFPPDLKLFKESVGCIKDLLQELSYREITLTLEQDSEQTLVGRIDDIDETSMYETLHQDNISVTEDITMRKVNECQFKVEPTSILLTPPIKIEDSILLHSENSKAMAFEITAEPKDIFNVSPKEGIIEFGDTIIVKVTCNESAVTGTDKGRIKVYIENDVMEVSIKSVLLQQKYS